MQFLPFLWISKLAKLVKRHIRRIDIGQAKRKVIQKKQNALDVKSYKVKCNLYLTI